MRFKTTLILLGIALVLGGVIWLLPKYAPPTEEQEKLKSRIIEFESDRVSRIEIKKGEEHIICIKDKDNIWRMTAPVTTRANESTVKSVLSQLKSLKGKEVIKPEERKDLSVYGLDQPRLVGSFGTEDKIAHLKIGNDAPLNRGVYLRIQDRNEIYVVDSSFFAILNKKSSEFRTKEVFDVDSSKIKRIKFIYPEELIEIQKKDDKWWLTQPVEDKTTDERVRDVLLAIEDLRADKFVADNETNLKQYGLDTPQLKITTSQSLKDKSLSTTVLFGNPSKKDLKRVYAMQEDSQSVFTVEMNSFNKLKVSTFDLRDKRLFSLKAVEITSLEIKKAKEWLVSLAKKNGVWQLVKPEGVKFEAREVKEFFRQLNDTEIKEFTDDKPSDLRKYGLAKPFLEITLAFSRDKPELKIALGSTHAKDRVYVKRSDETRVVAVGIDLYDYLNRGHLIFRKRLILAIPRAKTKRFTMEKRGAPKIVLKKDTSHTWTVVEPQGCEIKEVSKVFEMLDQLSHLKTLEFITDQSRRLNPYGLRKPFLKATIEYKEDKKKISKTLLIGNESPTGGYYAKMSDDDLIFVIEEKVVKSFQQDIIKQK